MRDASAVLVNHHLHHNKFHKDKIEIRNGIGVPIVLRGVLCLDWLVQNIADQREESLIPPTNPSAFAAQSLHIFAAR